MTIKINTETKIVTPDNGYRNAYGIPIAVSVNSIDDACNFIDDMWHDVVKAMSKISARSLFQGYTVNEAVGYGKLYALSMDDFVRQVNSIEFKPEHGVCSVLNGTIMSNYFRKITAKKKLEGLVDSLDFEMDKSSAYKRTVVEILDNLGFLKKEGDSILTLPKIKNEFVRYLLIHKLADSFETYVKEFHPYDSKNFDYTNIVKYNISFLPKKFKRSIITTYSAIALGITLLSGTASYVAIDAIAQKKIKEKTEVFFNSLKTQEITSVQRTYALNFKNLNTNVEDFRNSNVWLNESLRSSFYNCCTEENVADTSKLKKTKLSDIPICISELERDLAKNYGTSAVTVVGSFLSNFDSFSKYALSKADTIIVLETMLDNMYNSKLAVIKKYGDSTGYDVKQLYKNLNILKTGYEKQKSDFHMQFTLRMSPIEYFGMVFCESLYRSNYGSSLSANSNSKMIELSRQKNNILAGQFMERYLVHEKSEEINSLTFITPHGDYEAAALLVTNFYNAIKTGEHK